MRVDRLLKLADHLENGVLGHKEFSFRFINKGPFKDNGCGIMGCAIGECPIVFPDEWKFQEIGYNTFRPICGGLLNPSTSAQLFFDLNYLDVRVLFYPHFIEVYEQYLKNNNTKLVRLEVDATKEQVAANIRKFVEFKSKQA